MCAVKPSPSQKKNPDIELTPGDVNQTEKRVFFLTKELSGMIDKKAEDMFGRRKGNVSLYIEQALRVHLHMNLEGVNER